MGPKTQELVNLLTEMMALLDYYDEKKWANFFRIVKLKIVKLDYAGIQLLENAFGGMGSINDIVLGYHVHPESGEIIWEKAAKKANKQLKEQLSSVSHLITQINEDICFSSDAS